MPKRLHILQAATLLLLSSPVVVSAETTNDGVIPGNGIHDFDFMVGKWHVQNRRLKARAESSDEWIEFENSSEFYEPFMSGLANMDRSFLEFNGKPVEGVSLRVFDPEKDEWTIYWMADVYPKLTEQVRGRWTGQVGKFFGEEEYNGQVYKMRFLWTKLNNDHVRWEQAYFIPEEQDWETNWTMDMRRSDN